MRVAARRWNGHQHRVIVVRKPLGTSGATAISAENNAEACEHQPIGGDSERFSKVLLVSVRGSLALAAWWPGKEMETAIYA